MNDPRETREPGAEPEQYFMDSAPGARTVINGRTYLYFGGTGYFALHGHPQVIQAGIQALARAGTHSATGKTFGNTRYLWNVERQVADFFGTEDAVYYVSGILNGLFLAQSLAAEYDVAFLDEGAHYNLWDGIRSAGKPFFVYRHRDPADLAAQLRAQLPPRQRPMVLTDGVFPALGELAPVPDLLQALAPYGGILALDDAHGVGVLGDHGRGTSEHFGASGARLQVAGSLSKAFGGHGGFLPATRALAAFVKGNLGSYLGASSTPTPLAAASAQGLELVRSHPEWRATLLANAARLRAGILALGLETNETPFPIVAWSLASVADLQRVQAALREQGILVPIIRNYAGAPRTGLLRASVFSTHTPDQIDQLLAELAKVV